MVNEKLFTPLGFSKVTANIYRSAYPATKSLPFISQLHLKTMICLNPTDLRAELLEFCSKENIYIIKYELKHNQDPFIVMSEAVMHSIIDFIQNEENHPLLIFCNNGKVKTGCAVACLRRKMGWSISSIINEFEQFSDSEGGLCDLQFIESFQP